MRFFIYPIVFVFSICLSTLRAENIGLLVAATGKYSEFVSQLVESAERYFCKGHNVTYYIFTDGEIEQKDNIVRIEQPRLGWPYDTLLRYEMYLNNKSHFANEDYLFACDADMLFVNDVGSEILSDLVATLHPGFLNQRGSYERSMKSTARVRRTEGKHYFAGGFYGGTRNRVLHALETCLANIETDLNTNFIAVWHDESHWNRYCIDYPPTLILTPEYCYPESWSIPYTPRLIALDKDHQEFRK